MKQKDSKVHNATHLSQAIKNLFVEEKIDSAYAKRKVIADWEQIIGRTVALRTQKIFIKETTLFIKINSAPLKKELALRKDIIISRVNAYLGRILIQDVNIL